jgi:HNH endonuclease/AP2 domain
MYEKLSMTKPSASKESAITAQMVREVLTYDPETGAFLWRVNRRGTARVGTVAGTITPKGYRDIWVGGNNYRAHRLAWLYVYGSWPDGHIDHINQVKDDNRIANLRVATRSENMQNRRMYKNNASGFRGVYKTARGRWTAKITANGKKRYFGPFDSPEDAYVAYCVAAAELHTHNPEAHKSQRCP